MEKRWAAAAGAFVVAVGSAGVWAPAAEAAGTIVNRTCSGKIAGEFVKMKVTLQLRASGDNDINAVTIRATDRAERLSFRNADVDLRRLRMWVKDEAGNVVARSSVTNSRFAVDLGSAGKEVGRIRTEAVFRTHGAVGFVGCNFLFTDSGSDSGNS